MLRRTTAIAVSVLLALAACGSDDTAPSATTAAADPTTTTAPLPAPLTLLVTNDDGIGAPGIDVLVQALSEMDAVEVVVVAPAENQSGSSDKTTAGGAPFTDGVTASGVAGTAVAGFPADAIAVALDELGIEPDLVVSGINQGQNTGPLAYVSGTVGAGRVALRRGLPAIAGSAGLGEDADFAGAAALIVAFIEEHRDEYTGASGGAEAVVSFNVPHCTAGTTKELLEVPLATVIPEGVDPFQSDCTLDPAGDPSDDIAAVAAGHATVTLVPPEAPTG